MKQFANPPTPEPLGELSWHRLERSLFDALDAAPAPVSETRSSWPRRSLLAAGGLGAVLVAAVALLVLWPDADRGVTSNQISRLVTHESSSSMSVGDASLRADAHTALLVADNGDRGVSVMLERGAVECTVAKRPGRAPFRVVAGDVVVEVTGTIFRVERIGDSATVIVHEGVVSVLSRGVLNRVAAGERWPRETALAPTAPVPVPVPVLADDHDAGVERPTPTQTKTKTETKTKATPTPKATAKERYAAAARLESSDPGAALVIYRRLAGEGGGWAATALFAQGRLELELGEKTRARRTLKRYLRKHPSGMNAADARTLLEQLK